MEDLMFDEMPQSKKVTVFGEGVSHPLLVENVDQNAQAQKLRHRAASNPVLFLSLPLSKLEEESKTNPSQKLKALCLRKH